MDSKILNDGAERTHALVLERGDEAVSCIERYAREQGMRAARLTAVGAFEAVTLGFYDPERKAYDRLEFQEQMEVLALVGDLALADDGAKLHAHVVLGRRDGTTRGGHLLGATVRPTLEVMLVESQQALCRRHDPATGLALIDIGPASGGAG